MNIVKKGDYWWPEKDRECGQVTLYEANAEIPSLIGFCQKHEVCIQAGGNVGIWPVKLAEYFKQIYTFEPDPTNFECLKKNIENNGNILAFNAALGDERELVGMHCREDNCGAHFVEGGGAIPVVLLDQIIQPSACDLLLLDIEGYEYKAICGALEIIKRFKPVIVCEEKGLGEKYGVNRSSITSLLLELGYNVADKIANDVVYTCLT